MKSLAKLFSAAAAIAAPFVVWFSWRRLRRTGGPALILRESSIARPEQLEASLAESSRGAPVEDLEEITRPPGEPAAEEHAERENIAEIAGGEIAQPKAEMAEPPFLGTVLDTSDIATGANEADREVALETCRDDDFSRPSAPPAESVTTETGIPFGNIDQNVPVTAVSTVVTVEAGLPNPAVESELHIAVAVIEVSAEELRETPGGNGAQATEQLTVSPETESRAPLRRYKPPPQRPPRQESAQPAEQKAKRSAPTSLSLDIRVRLTFDRFGFCSIGFLPERILDLDEEIETKDGKSILGLVAQEDWYQDLHFGDIGDRLRQGFELNGLLSDHRQVRWRLSGRGVYVLAGHPKASGFVSTHRLHLGRSDVVLCVAEMLPQAEAILVSGGCQGYSQFDESYGVPPGWVALRGVLPTKALPLDQGSDPFYPLKAESDIQIELDGGLCLQHSVWLAGYPPRIKVLGASDEPLKVLIDGKRAEQTGEGAFRVEGYDQPGQHAVYCEGLARSRSYSIEEGPESWDEWPAYRFSQADICGPLVELPDDAVNRLAFAVPMSNPLLVGAEPGQIFRCSSRQAAHWKGYVPFDVIWALPGQPLICNKKFARILQFGDARPAPLKAGAKSVMSWSNAILDAARKGLRIDNAAADSAECWGEYKKTARNIRRGRR